MKKYLILSVLICLFTTTFAQPKTDSEPKIHWSSYAKKMNSNTYELIMKAKIDKGWHLYGQYFPDGGPVQLNFFFNTDENAYSLVNTVNEFPNPTKVKDDIYGIEVQYFSEWATFIQKIQIDEKTDLSNVVVRMEGQICKDQDGECKLTVQEFVFDLTK